ncbi:MAG: isopentenyl-diphosphate delta-isomerase [Euryarchaeota archaeon]|jgi:geranylgeranyl diphosphate synthase type I|nr:isopentenyl-diphosphate delta-isomerase [Euryarchaeota archaeon]MBT4982407.1 isopentenyl-diphosphate delta-isomerase [Euryarchaeota archaeon]MBT5183824.1 isopentenyl-diphosphate delta-isomerase [Euryarchaeota archaeon]
MSGYVIGDVPTVQVEADASEVLLGSDSIQESLMSEAVIQVTENDEIIGPVSKLDSHHQTGMYHRAFSVLLFDSSGRLLLQRRAAHKITFPNIWANSCCSHPLHSDDEMEPRNDLGVKRAAIRKLEQELGINPNQIDIEKFEFVTKMRYQARQDENWIEREIDHCLVIHADVEVNPNPNEVSEIKWVSQEELEALLIAEDPENVIAPWFRCIAARMMNDDWWRPGCAVADDLIHDMGDVSHMLPGATGADLNTSIAEVKELVEHRIERALKHTSLERLSGAMMHLLEGGGKRLRATLPWLVAKAVGDTHSGMLDVGAAIEIIHNFTLVHDDIMDDDEIRRGRPAVHIAYDLPTAINAGDAMLAIAFEAMAVAEGIEPAQLPFLVKRIGRMVRKCSEGQQLDIEFEDRETVSEEEYITMIHGKTAAMFLTCAEVGAHLAGADDETIQCMHEWGLSVGLCFQLMDDLIDVLSDSDTLGKPSGSDVAQGKRTLMVIHALNQPPSQSKDELLAVLGKGDNVTAQQVTCAHKALEDLGSIEYARTKAESYHRKAHDSLDRIPDSPAIRALRELTDYQLKRIY